MLRIALSATTVLALIFLVGAFIRPSETDLPTVPPEQLADRESRFISIEGVRVHYTSLGEGDSALILLHGFGAGQFTWQEVVKPLAKYGRVVTYDRPGFGLTERPLPGRWTGQNPYSSGFQDDLLIGLMDSLGIEKAILVGNSAGGNVAAQTALAYPDRVDGLVLVDASIYGHGAAKDLVQGILSAPIVQTIGPLIARIAAHFGAQFADSSWHDPSKLPPETRSAYQRQMQADHWDFGFWEAGRVGLPDDLAHRVYELELPTLVITGDDDGVVPTEDSVRLAGELPNAQLAIMADCGHVPNEECPDQFIQATARYLDSLEPTS